VVHPTDYLDFLGGGAVGQINGAVKDAQVGIIEIRFQPIGFY
jgi:hypothetical protein